MKTGFVNHDCARKADSDWVPTTMYEANSRLKKPVVSTRGWIDRVHHRADALPEPVPESVHVPASHVPASHMDETETVVPAFEQDGARVARSDANSDAETYSRLQQLFQIDLFRVLNWLRGGAIWIVALAILGAVGGYSVTIFVKPRFIAGIDILLDPANLRVVSNDIFSENMQRDTKLLDVDSKLRVITSGNVLGRVVKDLKLYDDPEFAGASSKDPANDALTTLAKRVVARRDERSFIVNVAVWSNNPTKSVDITNAVVTSFQEELAKAESEGAGRAASALIARLDDLKVEVTKAESNVEQFKRERGLQSVSGELTSTLMSQQTNTQLIEARARLIQAETRYNELVATDPRNQMNAASLQSETMTMLRTQYSTLKQRMTSQSAVLGPNHPVILTLTPQVKALEDQINAETGRIVQAAKTELDQARTALKQLSSQANQMATSVFDDSASQIQLRELEREARAKAAVYEAFMARAGEAAQRQQIDATNVRIVTPAVAPANRSFPPRGYLLAAAGGMIGLFLGLFVAVALGLWRDYRYLSEFGDEAYA
ncbi:GumC family protein [Rhizobium sp. 18065]|uniref:GumC family protein n=1 Tax=Rhizobium sp. 18065 TaxID=2681411 RepID=UPI001FCE8CBD|nr:GumC family protein [Rhizobium sp. 18065]